MNEIFEQNLKALEGSPAAHLKDSLKDAIERFRANPDGDPENKILKIVDGALGTKNLLFARRDPAFQAVYHSPDGISEAHNVIRGIDMKYPQIVFILGTGLGYTLEAFMSIKTKETWGINVVEKDPDIFVRAMAVTDFRDYFKNDNIRWSIGLEIEALKQKMVTFFEAYTTVNRSIKVIACPMSLQTECDYYSEAAKHIIPSRDQATIWAGNSLEDNFTGFQNTLNNIEFLASNPGIFHLKDKFKGKTCISVAAGPALNQAWDFLKEYQGRIPMIACDTLVKPMNDRGIAPDFYTALERDPIVADFFRGQKIDDRSTLVGPSLLLPDSFKCFEGRKLAYCASPPYSVNLDIVFLGPFSPGSSAGNLNLALAAWMGFKTVIMIGHNLAFAHGSNESHVKGTIDLAREKTKTDEEMAAIATGGKVATQDGESHVYTLMEYNLFRKQIEGLIAASPEMKFINTSAKGAKIAGAEFLTLQEAISTYATEDFDILPETLKLLENHKPEMEKRRLHRIYNRIKKCAEAIDEMTARSKDMERDIAAWKEDIEAAEAQGKRWSLAKLNTKIDAVLDLKVEGVNTHTTFSSGFVGVILPAHVVFERTINSLLGSHTDDYELKKDFLLQHEKYFKIWNKWLPRIKTAYQEAVDRVSKVLPPEPESLSEESPDLALTPPELQPQTPLQNPSP